MLCGKDSDAGYRSAKLTVVFSGFFEEEHSVFLPALIVAARLLSAIDCENCRESVVPLRGEPACKPPCIFDFLSLLISVAYLDDLPKRLCVAYSVRKSSFMACSDVSSPPSSAKFYCIVLLPRRDCSSMPLRRLRLSFN